MSQVLSHQVNRSREESEAAARGDATLRLAAPERAAELVIALQRAVTADIDRRMAALS